MYCKYCGKEVKEEDKICTHCGKDLKENSKDNHYINHYKENNNNSTRLFLLESEYKKREKSTFVAFLLWLFFSGFAAHRFYARRYISGTFLLLINFTFTIISIVKGQYYWLLELVPAFWIFIDLFLLRGMIREENYKIRRFVERIIK